MSLTKRSRKWLLAALAYATGAVVFCASAYAQSKGGGGASASEVIIGGLAGLLLIKSGLEFFGLIPPPHKKEIDKIQSTVLLLAQILKEETNDDDSETIHATHALIAGPIAEVCKTETGKIPPAWCTAGSLIEQLPKHNPEAEAMIAQNSEMVVRLLAQVLDQQKLILASLDNDRGK